MLCEARAAEVKKKRWVKSLQDVRKLFKATGTPCGRYFELAFFLRNCATFFVYHDVRIFIYGSNYSISACTMNTPILLSCHFGNTYTWLKGHIFCLYILKMKGFFFVYFSSVREDCSGFSSEIGKRPTDKKSLTIWTLENELYSASTGLH